jgi:hypothetical protein
MPDRSSIVTQVQRWRDRRDSYRPAGEPIQTRWYEVAAMEGDGSDNTAKGFVEKHHYSGTFPAARFRYGLYRGPELVGVAVFSQPCRAEVVTNVFPVKQDEAVDLGRFVLLDNVPANGESWFLARCFDLLRQEVAGVVSFSDPFPRMRTDGTVVMPGHVGTIYQASNACYLGRARADTLRLLPNGRSFPNRAVQKIRKRDRGWRYAVQVLVDNGATAPGEGEDLGLWVDRWLSRLTRKVRHPGNHKYAWAFDRSLRRHLPESKPYPKQPVIV